VLWEGVKGSSHKTLESTIAHGLAYEKPRLPKPGMSYGGRSALRSTSRHESLHICLDPLRILLEGFSHSILKQRNSKALLCSDSEVIEDTRKLANTTAKNLLTSGTKSTQ
jgi:hypothetical protein